MQDNEDQPDINEYGYTRSMHLREPAVRHAARQAPVHLGHASDARTCLDMYVRLTQQGGGIKGFRPLRIGFP